MKNFILFVLFLLICATCIFAQTNLPVGTIRRPIITDNSGNGISTNIVFSNQVVMVAAPSLSNHLARLQDITNNASVNFALTNATSLIGPYTITIVSKTARFSTNGSSLFFTGSITNLGPGLGSSNVTVYTLGILTNKFTIP